MPRKRRVYHEKGAGKRIATDAMRGEDGDPLGELNALDLKLFRYGGTHVFIPIADDVACRRSLMFLRYEINGLIASMDRLPDRRAKSLLALSTLQRWSQAFKREAKRNCKLHHALT